MCCLLQGTMERRKKLHEARKPLLRQPAPPTVSITITDEQSLILSPPVSCAFVANIDNHVVESEWLNNRVCRRNPDSGKRGAAVAAARTCCVASQGAAAFTAQAPLPPQCTLPAILPSLQGRQRLPTPYPTLSFAEIEILLFDRLVMISITQLRQLYL